MDNLSLTKAFLRSELLLKLIADELYLARMERYADLDTNSPEDEERLHESMTEVIKSIVSGREASNLIL